MLRACAAESNNHVARWTHGRTGQRQEYGGCDLPFAGVYVVEADAIGRALMQPGESVYDAVVAHFGEEILLPRDAKGHRHLDRGALAKLIFENGRIEELNRIVHPAVIAAQAQWMDDIAQREPDAIAMVEVGVNLRDKAWRRCEEHRSRR